MGKRDIAPIIIGGLKRLEYRGYDSAGVATLVNGRIERRRAELLLLLLFVLLLLRLKVGFPTPLYYY